MRSARSWHAALMPLYARTPGRRALQIGSDVFVLVWCVTWWVVGQTLASVITALASTADATATASADVDDRLTQVADVAGSVPLVGSQLADPFTQLAAVAASLSTAAAGQVEPLTNGAGITGWLTFLLPVAAVVLVWLPRRIRFARNARALQAIAQRPGSTDLLALRALTTLSPVELARIDGDPAAGWRNQDPATLTHLAHLALVSGGVARPAADG